MMNFEKDSNIQSSNGGYVSSSDMSAFISKTYGWMFFALMLSGLAAWYVGHHESALLMFLNHPFLLLGAEFALVFAMGFFINKISYSVASLLFVIYSLLNGVTLGFYFLIYTQESIVSTFFVSALTFGAMSLYGYFTKTDLTTIGNYLKFALVGLIIASIVNMFLKSEMVSYVASYIGVAVFIGLTAYDTQKIKNLACMNDGSEGFMKLSLLAALNIYLDFINLFIYLLRIFGSRRD